MNRIILPFLLLALSFAPILCRAAEPNSDQAKSIAEIKRLGGKVALDEKTPGKPVIEVDLWDTNVTDTELEHLKGLTQLWNLWLDDTQVTDRGLRHLKGLKKLEDLHLQGTKVSDAGLEHLQGFARLESLNLEGTKVTDAGLVYLNGLRRLNLLWLGGTKVTGAGVQGLQMALPECTIER